MQILVWIFEIIGQNGGDSKVVKAVVQANASLGGAFRWFSENLNHILGLNEVHGCKFPPLVPQNAREPLNLKNDWSDDNMSKITSELLNRHIKSHTERSSDDSDAVSTLQHFLNSGGRINHVFSCNDKWPNTDGMFELVPKPEHSRQPKQRFAVQIKGTNHARFSRDGTLKYQLKSLAFPAYVAQEITLDPSVLFLVIDPRKRHQERVFWKYISPRFLASIDFSKDTATVDFTVEDEIEDSTEGIDQFIEKLSHIADAHSYVKQLEPREYEKEDVLKLITARCESISEAIQVGTLLHDTRDRISRKILTELEDLCKGTLLLNGLRYYDSVNLRTAWELALLDIKTKFLATFLQGLRYIGLRVPEEGQYERLILKYYGFLWKIRAYLQEFHGLSLLGNLETFPRRINDEDEEYNKLLAKAIESVALTRNRVTQDRYYVQKNAPFYVGDQRYFEITLQLSDKYATKYNRLTVYSKVDISSNYSIQVGYAKTEIQLWDKPSEIKVVTDWRVSIEPAALNKLSAILKNDARLSSVYNEYRALMDFLTSTGISLLNFIDLKDKRFQECILEIYQNTNTSYFKDVLLALHDRFHANSTILGKNTIRYALIKLREELLEDLLPEDQSEALNCGAVYLSKKCYAFEQNPIFYNLPGKRTNGKTISRDVLRATGTKGISGYLPYIRIKHLINSTGEVYFRKEEIEYKEAGQTIEAYNALLSKWDKEHGRLLKEDNEYVYLDEYVKNTAFILQNLLCFSSDGNDGQQQLNQSFISGLDQSDVDCSKIEALRKIFVESRVLMIYGAAGTGKTTLMNYISDLMDGRSKLFLAKTHTALENLERRIKSPGYGSAFMGIDSFTKSRTDADYDVIFVDECSTIDNRTMVQLLQKVSDDSLLVFAGDTYQIESIDFGNWFFYAKEILPEKSVAELKSTWRTQNRPIRELWEAVRSLGPIITEMLVIDGPFSENIGKDLFERASDDEVILCLNYDGKFGLNSINRYFQDANPSTETYDWSEWRYKVGDPVLFNESKRFPALYNNLKGTIAAIEQNAHSISFTVDIPIVLTAIHLKNTDIERISGTEKSTLIRFTVYEADERTSGEQYEEARKKSIVPFQLAYAISIHKAQGLEYDSIKIVIPNSNSERISHGIFYTAITRTKDKLKIFCSSDTMDKIISGFSEERDNRLSLDIIKAKLIED